MTNSLNNERLQNIILVFLLITVTLFTAFHEGYFPLISIPFWISIVIGFSISMWLAWTISTRRLLSLILGIFIIEYIKETIGIRSGFWSYHGVNGLYIFGVWAWVLGGLMAFTISTKVAIRQLRRLKISVPRWSNPAILAIISLFIPLTLGDYWSGAGKLFWLFYILIIIAGIYVSFRMDFFVFSGIVITAWVVGGPSEYIGSMASNVWTYTHNPCYPPFFLLFACWPLEILALYSLSAFLAKEPFDKDTF
ncbi:MAG: hypothetical protein ACUZ77_08125 [Candidatus Brocadiales bacterium]